MLPEILHIDQNKNRTDSWFQALRLQLPAGVTNYGSIGRVTYVDKNVKGEIPFGAKDRKTVMQVAFESPKEKNSPVKPKFKNIRELQKNRACRWTTRK